MELLILINVILLLVLYRVVRKHAVSKTEKVCILLSLAITIIVGSGLGLLLVHVIKTFI